MNNGYQKLSDALKLIGDALVEISGDNEMPQIKLLVTKMVNDMNLNSEAVLETISWFRFAVDNEDFDLAKLTAFMVNGSSAKPVEVEAEVEGK